MNRRIVWALALAALLPAGVAAVAQQPTQAQISAIRGACRGDYMNVCANTPTGGPEALRCLEQHTADVSAGLPRSTGRPWRRVDVGRRCYAARATTPAGSRGDTAGATAAAAGIPCNPAGSPVVLAAHDHARGCDGHGLSAAGNRSGPTIRRLPRAPPLPSSRPGQSQPVLGTIELTLATQTDEATGIVHLSDPTLLNSHFPSLDTQQAQDLQAEDQGGAADDGDARASR